jgi:hypothetical protein
MNLMHVVGILGNNVHVAKEVYEKRCSAPWFGLRRAELGVEGIRGPKNSPKNAPPRCIDDAAVQF